MNQPIELLEPEQATATTVDLTERVAHLPATRQDSVPATASQKADPYHMLQIAVERGMSPEVIEKFMGLAERMEAMRERERQRVIEGAYTKALADLKAEVVTVVKRKRVHFSSAKGVTDYKHAELSDIMEAVADAAKRVGLSWNYPELDQGTDPRTSKWITVTCRLKHVDGYSESLALGGPPDDSGNKNPMQQIHSAITYLERITLKALLGIAEKGDDNDGRGSGKKADATPEQESELEALRQAGQAAALNGMNALTKWWGSLNNKQRSSMNPEFGGLRMAARAADQPVEHVEESHRG